MTLNSDQWWNYDKCRCECKISHVCGKDYVWNPAKPNCKNEMYLASIMDDLAIMLDEVIDSYNDQTNFNEKKLLAFLLITIALLIAVSIYSYLIKYGEK